MVVDTGWLTEHIRDVPDFPLAGVMFKDITPLLGDGEALKFVVDTMADHFAGLGVEKVLGIEARGFIVAAPVAYRLGAGFVPVRKAGKLPWRVETEEYALEYGTDRLQIHADALRPGERVLVIDDVLATGGTASACARLVEKLGAKVAGLGFVIELEFLNGRSRVEAYDAMALLTYG
ncbi:MAG TPA: adenine phosphoribosyltransferase [Acidimicrobiales bacterium]|nr:adenine phosphoribosyltransferase [Acidimicrobiales bacterium]